MVSFSLLVRLTLNWRVGSAVDEMMDQFTHIISRKVRPKISSCIGDHVHQFIESLGVVELKIACSAPVVPLSWSSSVAPQLTSSTHALLKCNNSFLNYITIKSTTPTKMHSTFKFFRCVCTAQSDFTRLISVDVLRKQLI